MRLPIRLRACLAALLACAGSGAWAAPSTFGPVIGSALLCRSHLDNKYFLSYLTSAFGPSYKREGGAYWFKADGLLWGTPVTDILLSDDSSELVFVGAVTDAAPGLTLAVARSRSTRPSGSGEVRASAVGAVTR